MGFYQFFTGLNCVCYRVLPGFHCALSVTNGINLVARKQWCCWFMADLTMRSWINQSCPFYEGFDALLLYKGFGEDGEKRFGRKKAQLETVFVLMEHLLMVSSKKDACFDWWLTRTLLSAPLHQDDIAKNDESFFIRLSCKYEKSAIVP